VTDGTGGGLTGTTNPAGSSHPVVLLAGIGADDTRGLWVTNGTAAGTHEVTGISGVYAGGAAIESPAEKKQEFLRHAADYLAVARKQDERSDTTPESIGPEGAEDQHRQIRQLIKEALDLPTPEDFEKFLDFNTSFRRLGIWNARMGLHPETWCAGSFWLPNTNGKRSVAL
jgi:hypothetical protein